MAIQLKGANYFRIDVPVSTTYYTLDPTDLNGNLINEITIDCDSTLGDIFVILPEIALFQNLYSNFKLIINDVGNTASTNPIVISSSGGDLVNVDGNSTAQINVNGASLVFQVLTETHWLCVESENLGAPTISIEQTNIFYVDPLRTQDYTPTGTILYPYFTINDALTAVITINNYNANNPAFICLNNSTTEDIILTKGHIFLTASQGTGTHGAPQINGKISIDGQALSKVENHFSISNLRIVAPDGSYGITTEGSNPQQVFLSNLWIDASTTGACIYAKNNGLASTCHLNTGHLTHSGTGDIYCIDVQAGTMTITDIETSGNVQVCAVRAGATCTIDSSELDGNNGACLEVYGGTLVVTRSVITNAQADGHGIALLEPNSVALVGECSFSIPVSATGKCVYNGGAPNVPVYLVYQYVSFINPTNPLLAANRGLSATVTASALATTFVP